MAETGITGLMKIVLRVVSTLIGVVAGHQIYYAVSGTGMLANLGHPYMWLASSILLFAAIGFIVSPILWWALKKMGHIFENNLQNVSMPDLIVALIGLIIGLIVATLIAIPFSWLGSFGFYIAVVFYVLFAYLGMRSFIKRREDIWPLITNIGDIKTRLSKKGRRKDSESLSDDEMLAPDGNQTASAAKILDTSVIIDGRILDVTRTGFIDGQFILPRFVLAELQGVADSSDPLRRTRGRRGLSVVTELQKITGLDIRIPEITLRELKRENVDEALVVLAHQMQGKILTTDYNLNQIAKIEGVEVLNINDLANALKPLLLPGETVQIDIIRAGKEPNQGVGYLDDGTMLVIEDGERSIGMTVQVTITSMLQTSAGRMIFGRIKR